MVGSSDCLFVMGELSTIPPRRVRAVLVPPFLCEGVDAAVAPLNFLDRSGSPFQPSVLELLFVSISPHVNCSCFLRSDPLCNVCLIDCLTCLFTF